MSTIEQLKGTEAWFTQLKNFLLKDRPHSFNKGTEEEAEKQYPSIDLSPGFKEIVKERGLIKMDFLNENKENEFSSVITTKESQIKRDNILSTASYNTANVANVSGITYLSHNDTTIIDEPSIWRQTTEESFERVEKMCNKTISDPDSTLYKYVKSFKEKKEDNESEALDRLFDEFGVKCGRNRSTSSDETQIANIEPPSCIWEDTLAGDALIYQKSPVKMVGLLRPSTILEESSSMTESMSNSSSSFKSTQKSEESTEQYETASETGTKSTNRFGERAEYKDVSDSVLNFKATNKSTEQLPREDCNETISLRDSYFVRQDSIEAKECYIRESEVPDRDVEANFSFPSIDVFPHKKHVFYGPDLKKGLLSPDKSQMVSVSELSNSTFPSSCPSNTNKTSEGISSFTNDSLDNSKEQDAACGNFIGSFDNRTVKVEEEVDLIDFKTPRKATGWPTAIIELSDSEGEEDGNDSSLKIPNDSDLNQAFSTETAKGDSINISREFNDTIEEMEYIMQQGMKYMTEKGTTPTFVKSAVLSTKNILATPKLNTATHIPSPKNTQGATSKLFGNVTRILSPQKLQGMSSTIKPEIAGKVKVDSFKKPQINFRIPQSKTITGIKKHDNFKHVISPVGAYIKNTPKVPLTTNAKPGRDVYQSKAARELEYNTKVQINRQDAVHTKPFAALPKKAYVSAEYKHVVDQRVPVTIPGGNKIHQYLQPSPTVIRHEGKVKLDKASGEKDCPANRTVDSTLVDLSVISGEVSLLTIKDAKKFAG